MIKTPSSKKQMIFQIAELKSPVLSFIFLCLIIYLSLGLWGRDPWRQGDLIYIVKLEELIHLPINQLWQMLTIQSLDTLMLSDIWQYLSNDLKIDQQATTPHAFHFFNGDWVHPFFLIQSVLVKMIQMLLPQMQTIDLLRIFFICYLSLSILFIQSIQKQMAKSPQFKLIEHPFHSTDQSKIWQKNYENLLRVLPVILLAGAIGSALYLHEGTEELAKISLISALFFTHFKMRHTHHLGLKIIYALGYVFVFFLLISVSTSLMILAVLLQISILLHHMIDCVVTYQSSFKSTFNHTSTIISNGFGDINTAKSYVKSQLKFFVTHFFKWHLCFHIAILVFAVLKFSLMHQALAFDLSKIITDKIRLSEWLREFPAFSWPLLPLALYGFWQRPRELLLYLLSILAVCLIYIAALDFSRQILLLTLPALIILATWGVILLPRAWHRMLINLGYFLFIGLAVGLILILLAWKNPVHSFYFWPELAFVNQDTPMISYVFVIMILLVGLYGYRYIKIYQESVIYAPLIWALGLLICWMIFITLYLSPINQVKTYREVVSTINLYIPANQCANIDRLSISQESALRYFSTFKIDQNQNCRFLIKNPIHAASPKNISKNNPLEYSAANDLKFIWQGSRLMSKGEIFVLYEKTQKTP
jgi:hypothetical protein